MPDQTLVSDAATEPKSASADGVSVQNHSLDELIRAEKHLAAKSGASKPHRGLRFSKLVPPGTSGGQ
jgi:hypothetical protein